MRQQLFFETADVKFPIEGNYGVDQLFVKLVSPSDERGAASDDRQPKPQVTSAGQPVGAASVSPAAEPVETSTQRVPPNAEDTDLQRSLKMQAKMQANSVDVAEVRNPLYQRLQKIDELSRQREIVRIDYGDKADKTAFLLPLGVSGKEFEALLFFPWSPRLPLGDNICGVLGLLCAGAAVASLIINSRFHSQIAELRTHMSLLRSLQVGVVKARPDYEITECNDRAEELCGRRLPKPGVKLDPSINFFDMFDLLVKHDETGYYKEIKMKDIQKARHSGQASSYYARLRTDSVSRWLFVRATPIMEPERVPAPETERAFPFRRRKMWQMTLQGAFATITDTCKDRVEALEAQFPTRQRE
jgi:PAS domain-containing protein